MAKLSWTALLVALLLGCGDSKTPASSEPTTEAELLAKGYTRMNGYLVPPVTLPDATLPDSCLLLTEADPQGMLTEPLGPIERMSHVCVATAEAKPGYQYMIAVEVRHPSQLELDDAGFPKDIESYWLAEGAGVELMGGKREELKEIPGLGDFATWYPITLGLGLQAYSKGQYIVRVTIRGVDLERSLSWAKTVTQRALDACTALEQQASDKQG